MNEQMKACPFCAEDIQATAIKCRYCGSMLSGQGSSAAGGRARPIAGAYQGFPCPKCGSRLQVGQGFPWYLGTIGAMLMSAVTCAQCGHEFDTKKPQADLATRKRNLAIAINGVGFLGIVAVIGGLVALIVSTRR